MNFKNNPLEDLRRLTEAVKNAGADIAPTYMEYIQMAFAIATDCGEAGRIHFIELCSLSPKFDAAAAHRLFTNTLHSHRDSVHLGTVFHLASLCGVNVPHPLQQTPDDGKIAELQKVAATFSHARACARETAGENTPGSGLPPDDDFPGGESGAETWREGSEPFSPLPTFDQSHRWPGVLERILSFATSVPQRDALLLCAINALGSTLSRHLRCLYSQKWLSPCLQTFIVAPPASGKSALAWVRHLVEPIHDEIRREVEKEMERYRQEKAAYDSLGKERAKTPPPVMPRNRMFLISGNNTGTGILQNVIDSGGEGIICETEADTVSTAIGSDYGNWSATLRHAFDQDRMSYNRRTDHEYRELERSYLSVLISGTPAQVQPLIPSAENGLFSRQVFYYMPGVREWTDQFGEEDIDIDRAFLDIGHEWKETLDGIKRRGMFTLRLTDGQKAAFNRTFDSLFRRSRLTNGNEMDSSVVRLAVNLCRMLSVVAMLRSLDDPSLARVPAGIAPDNRKDGIVTRWDLDITLADFDAVLSMAEPLYLHAAHILSFLSTSEVKGRSCANKDMLFARMGHTFTRQELLEAATEMNIPLATANSWLYRLLAARKLSKGKDSGAFIKNEL